MKTLKKIAMWIIGIFLILFIIGLFLPDEEINNNKNIEKTETPDKIIEIRRSIKGVNIRKGPGTEFEKNESGSFFEGEPIYVLKEKDGWLYFRCTLKDKGWNGWVKKDLTISEHQYLKNCENSYINELKEKGILTVFNPLSNEAYVNTTAWLFLEYRKKEIICIKLAEYCEFERGNDLFYVNIKDSYTGKKIAKYSKNWGFKTY